jgi:hypothetical protein
VAVISPQTGGSQPSILVAQPLLVARFLRQTGPEAVQLDSNLYVWLS